MELTITLHQPHRRAELFGPGDRHLRQIRDTLGVKLQARSATVRILGEPPEVARAAAVLERLQELLRNRSDLDDESVLSALAEVDEREGRRDPNVITVFSRDVTIAPKTDGQRHYIQAMLANDLVVCLGPAGTGKTYLAVALAVHQLKRGDAKRIVLVRPAVEAGEKLGYLPGDLQQKVNPYLRPLFDAMHDMMTFDQLKRFMVNDIIEVIPLAYMRGRTLNSAIIILDEAQNATPSQMLMFLTRLGHHSRMIVTGDDSQIDLEPNQPSGLIDAVRRLRGVPGVEILRLTELDIVRHRLVQRIVARYSDRAGGPRLRPADAEAEQLPHPPESEASPVPLPADKP
ncbi:MAG: PhoH family protein [Phycisphaerales bacterium]|nr:PhoH family protein [Phycisphaerales bacterium]